MRGVKQLAEIFLEAGATKVMPSTYRYRSFKRGEDLDPLYDYVNDRTGISLNSAHPQGGNAISVSADKGVVDSSFKVHGLENVYVCDASVFPSSITVNPQYTVMALASYASFKMTGVENIRPGPRVLRPSDSSGSGSGSPRQTGFPLTRGDRLGLEFHGPGPVGEAGHAELVRAVECLAQQLACLAWSRPAPRAPAACGHTGIGCTPPTVAPGCARSPRAPLEVHDRLVEPGQGRREAAERATDGARACRHGSVDDAPLGVGE